MLSRFIESQSRTEARITSIPARGLKEKIFHIQRLKIKVNKRGINFLSIEHILSLLRYNLAMAISKKWLIVGIVLLGFLIRAVAIDKFPVGFTADEASFGYDAYSILKTGRDQWGQFLPIVLKSFGDYKSPLYAYLTIPSILIFGLTKFAVRLPNAMVGASAVYFVYLLAGELGRLANLDEKRKKPDSVIGSCFIGRFSMAYNVEPRCF